MIRESLYFTFAGRKSSDFGIVNVSVSSGLYEESLFASRSIKETQTRGRNKRYFHEVEREPLSFQVKFLFTDKYNDRLIEEVIDWLDVDYYEPLIFEANQEHVYYAMPINEISHIHNGCKQGYLTLTMRCDSPYKYSNFITTRWFDYSENRNDFIEILNDGNLDMYPEIDIVKVNDGDLRIINLTNRGEEFLFKGLKNKEELYVNCENEEIETNIPNTWRYDNFNDNYLKLVKGFNRLQVIGNAKIRFRYYYTFK